MLRNPSRRRPSHPTTPNRRRRRPAVEPLEGRLALALMITGLTPAAGATGVCVDTPLTIQFNQAPMLGTGNIVVHNAADGSVVDTVAVTPGATATALSNVVVGAVSQRTIGGNSVPYNFYQVFINTANDTATIYLHQALSYGQTYYVTMDAGTFTDAAGDQSAAITDPSAWRFATKASAPPAGTTQLTVAADGSGDFATVQGAIDFVPANIASNAQRVYILVRKGTYNEINYVPSNKSFITVYGEDRNQTVIRYPNNNTFNAKVTGNNRIMFFNHASDFALANITLHNITPQGGSQAEAFGNDGRRTVVDGVNLLSLQDTFYDPAPGTEYVVNSFIAGNVDFMWGNGTAFFQNDELQAVGGTNVQYYAQVRNAQGASAFNSPGFVYVNCHFTRSDASVTNSYLARIDPRPSPNGFPYSQMVLINCTLAPNILPVGWLLNNATTAPSVRFWEYNSTDPSGNPIDVSQRAPFSSQMSAELVRRWSNPTYVLAGWTPDPSSVLPPGLQITAAGPAR
jgi:pectin methylesterase-like acyl-CoA thioesterase